MRVRQGADRPMRESVRLRRATAADQRMIVHVCTMARLQAFVGPALPAGEIRALVDMQVKAEERRRSLRFPMASSYLVLDRDTTVGRLVIDVAGDELRLIDLTLLPEAQGHAIGTTVMLGVRELATEKQLTVMLATRRDERVLAFLDRLGFEVVRQEGPAVYLRWSPPPAEQGQASSA